MQHPDTAQALKLYTLLSGNFLQNEFGHFITGLQNKVHYPNHPDASREVQHRLNELVKRMAIVYLFSIWDDYQTEPMRNAVNPDEQQLLKAYRHIRNSAAHGVLFERAPNCRWRGDFEAVANAGQHLNGVVFDVTALDLTTSGADIHCQQFMAQLAQQLVSRLANQ